MKIIDFPLLLLTLQQFAIFVALQMIFLLHFFLVHVTYASVVELKLNAEVIFFFINKIVQSCSSQLNVEFSIFVIFDPGFVKYLYGCLLSHM